MPRPNHPSTLPSSTPEVRERRRQSRGLLYLALAVLALSILRAGVPHVFTVGWWRLW